MTLSEKQQKFAVYVAKLILYAESIGYAVTFGEALRTIEQQKLYVQQGKSKTLASKHLDRLAVDLNLFIEGEYKTDKASYIKLGAYWKYLDVENVWGGDFSFGDANHFQYTK